MAEQIVYKPTPILEKFIAFHKRNELFQCWVTGPVGSGKTTADFMKLVYLAGLEQPDPDGVKRTKCVIVRNTMPQLKDTTIASWRYWFKDGQAGEWKETDKTFTLKTYDKGKLSMECIVMFRALDTPDDVARVLSLEMNFCIVDEFVQIPYQIIEALSGRLGRYKRPDGTKPSIYGMWGASNTDTEDNWWFDYLHRTHVDPNRNMPDDSVARYFVQPSGLSPEAENLDNLPNNYYTNLIKGKSPVWVKQFVEGEWGFSTAGTPVFSAFSKKRHVVRGLTFNKHLPLVIGFDPGLGGSAFVFTQLDLKGRLNFLGELVQSGLAADRLIEERLKPYIAARFPGAKVVISVDPAARNRSPNDGTTILRTVKQHFDYWTESNNRLPLRLNALDHFAQRNVGCDEPAMQIDEDHCPTLIRGFAGGWRWETHPKKDMFRRDEPEDTPYTHVCDAAGYAARYFHKRDASGGGMRTANEPPVTVRPFKPVLYNIR